MSVAIGSDGLGLISYRRRNAEGDVALKVAHCSNIACTTATISTLLGDIGGSTSTSIAIGADGLGLISYHDYAQNSVNVAHCSNVVCSEATISTLDTEVRGEFSSTAIGADGLGLVAYWQDEPGHDDDRIKVAHCSNVACTKATTTTVGPGVAPAITIGGDGLALMSYESGDSLRVAHCLDLGCTTTEMSPIVDDVAALSAITTGSDGLGLISYVVDSGTQLTGVSVAHCEDVACSSATLSPVRAGGRYEEYTSITVGTDGLAFISYHDVNGPVVGTLRAAHCRNLACTSSSLTTVDGTDDVGASNSTTLGADGLPLIAYVSGNDLGVAHCSNVFCVPYFRRR